MRILLIEDDRALCTALLPALQAAGYTVDTCHDGADGKTLLCGGAYDVCVLDRMLPGLDGLSLLRAARAKGCTTPVLMLTALSGINDRVDGLDAGADDYLGKPFDTRELLARLRALTRRPGTTAESAIRCGDVTLDAAQLTLSGPKAAAALTKREADLLERYCCAHRGSCRPVRCFWRGFGDHWPKLRTLIWTVTSILCGGG